MICEISSEVGVNNTVCRLIVKYSVIMDVTMNVVRHTSCIDGMLNFSFVIDNR